MSGSSQALLAGMAGANPVAGQGADTGADTGEERRAREALRAREASDLRRSLSMHVWWALGAIILLMGGLGGWAVAARLSGAVIASGSVVVDSAVKKVQHPSGGVVGSIFVRDGDKVREGDVLVALDPTIPQANLALIEKSLDELLARQGRLQAERDGLSDIAFPDEIFERKADPEVARTLSGEQRLFELRRDAREGKRAQLREQRNQLDHQVDGLERQLKAKNTELQLIGRELVGMRQLAEKKLITVDRVTALERDEARLEGEKGQLIASIAQTRTRSSEIALALLQIDQDLRSDTAAELRDVASKITQSRERRVAAADQAARVEIRAPQDGVVHQLAVHTVGGVIQPGEALMLIVPVKDPLVVEARIEPRSVEQVQVGASAHVRFSAFNQSVTPDMEGTVMTVSPDVTADQRTGQAFYVARVSISPDQSPRLAGVALVPGMPADVFIKTNDRTVFSYLMKPVMDHVVRAWRDG